MEALLQQVVAGLATGGIYASIALALVMIYQSTHQINFAQGEMGMFATYIAWALIHWGMPYWPAFFLTVVIAFLGGAFLQRTVLRPLENASHLANIVVFVGLMITFNSLAGLLFTYTIKTFPSPFPNRLIFDGLLSFHQLGAIVVTGTVLLLLFAFFKYTHVGLAIRAGAQNPLSARLVGIRVSHMLALGWGLAAAIGAIAGMMVAPIVFLEPNMMSGILLYGFAGALIGGIDNPWGAVAGGFIIGVLENLLGAYVIGTELKLTATLMIIIAVLLFKPAGLFGQRIVKRV